MLPGAHLEERTFERLIAEALAMAPDTLDKRQGSILYDTLAVGDVQLAQGYALLRGYYLDAYALTAAGEALDLKAAEAGLARYAASRAVKRADFADEQGKPMAVPAGAVFSTALDAENLRYTVAGPYANEAGVAPPGAYALECAEAGTQGNDYVGPLIPVTRVEGLASAEMGALLIPARDREDDEALRARFIDTVTRRPYGGNTAQYRAWAMELPGVGAARVYPVWRGGGTVKLSILGADFMPASPALLRAVQEAFDPEACGGEGWGIAPIGHAVTVATPEALEVDIEADVRLLTGYSAGIAQDEARGVLEEVLLEERRAFGKETEGGAYRAEVARARVIAALMDVDGVDNVPRVRLNGLGEDEDLSLPAGAELQQVPVLGEVILREI